MIKADCCSNMASKQIEAKTKINKQRFPIKHNSNRTTFCWELIILSPPTHNKWYGAIMYDNKIHVLSYEM